MLHAANNVEDGIHPLRRGYMSTTTRTVLVTMRSPMEQHVEVPGDKLPTTLWTFVVGQVLALTLFMLVMCSDALVWAASSDAPSPGLGVDDCPPGQAPRSYATTFLYVSLAFIAGALVNASGTWLPCW